MPCPRQAGAGGQDARSRDGQDVMDRMSGMRREDRMSVAARYAAGGQEARSRDGQDVMDRMSGMRREDRMSVAARYAVRG